MSEPRPTRVEDLFYAAVDLPPEQRAAFLDEQCGDDAGLRAAVERLLRDDEGGGPSFSAGPPPDLWATVVQGPRREVPALLAGTDSQLPAVPGCQVLEELGRGGMGVVFRARELDFGRTLAVKVLLARHAGNADLARRFLEEAQVAAQLQHPGVPPIHARGRLQDGRPYFVMKLVEGRTLADLLKQRQGLADDLPRFLGIFEQVCQTVAYAHSHKIIHRDLKPQNIMVGAFGEVQVMDWGLAKVIGSDDDQPTLPDEGVSAVCPPRAAAHATVAGSVLGTPNYMSPEQARGQVYQLDARADVFSLGAVLCVLLTGKPPYVGDSPLDTLQKAEGGDLAEALARLGSCGADAELIDLAKRCLRADCEGRPGSAEDVARAVAAYQLGARERLRTAELAGAEARARAEEERKTRAEAEARLGAEQRARWRTLALAAALLGLVAVGAWLWNAEARRHHEAALREGELRRNVQAMLGRAEQWQQQAKWREALALLEQARDMVGEGAPDDLRDEVETRLAELELVKALDDVRQKKAMLVEGAYDESRADPEYEAVFARAGLANISDGPAEAVRWAERLQAREQVVAAFDDWASITKDKNRRAWLLQIARRLGPDPLWGDRFRQPVVWNDRDALQRLADKADLARLPPSLVSVLARRLWSTGADPVPLLRRAQAMHPADFWLSFDLGTRLAKHGGSPDLAEGYLRAALAVRPDSAAVQFNLGSILLTRGQFDEAIAALRKATELDTKYSPSYTSLGLALRKKGRKREALAAFQKAVTLGPNDANAHYNRGLALYADGQLDEAIVAYQRAVALKPGYAKAHVNLGAAYHATGRLDEAIASYRKGISLDDSYAECHCNLGLALMTLGEFAKALKSLKRGHELGSRKLAWRARSAGWIAQCERMISLEGKLPDVLRGDAVPTNANTYLGLAEMCRYKKRYRDAARFWADAFRLEPTLVQEYGPHYRYKAARDAALAAAGKGHPAADESDRARLRQQALTWLRGELAAWRNAAEKASNASAAQFALSAWKDDSGLASVRDARAQALLAPKERADWRRLWADVDELLARLKRKPKN
jgi:tetratricopeptide (TPR) repeat protein